MTPHHRTRPTRHKKAHRSRGLHVTVHGQHVTRKHTEVEDSTSLYTANTSQESTQKSRTPFHRTRPTRHKKAHRSQDSTSPYTANTSQESTQKSRTSHHRTLPTCHKKAHRSRELHVTKL
ncbi:hypothetical protein ACJMK2_008681 [Sinanodonta woodiana]|uniref:Uncharacterized protein n=1 Tax=Sinanodonta woodiana TaxID=1069815 RepID=A0ABD3VNX1_SINWO